MMVLGRKKAIEYDFQGIMPGEYIFLQRIILVRKDTPKGEDNPKGKDNPKSKCNVKNIKKAWKFQFLVTTTFKFGVVKESTPL